MLKYYYKFSSFIYGCISIGALVLLWEYASIRGWGHVNIFPPPSHFLGELFNNDFRVWIGSNSSTITESILSSIWRVLAGLTIGAISAIIIGSLITSSVWLRRLVLPVIRILAPIAPIAWIPLALVMFSIWNSAAVFIVFMWVFFVLVIATISAIDIVPQNLINSAKTLWITNKFTLWRRVILPSIGPSIFTMLRLNFLAAWMAVLAAEMTGLRDWLWAIIMTGRNLFNNDLILLWMMLIWVVWFCFDIVLRSFQNKFLWWDKLIMYGNKINNNPKK